LDFNWGFTINGSPLHHGSPVWICISAVGITIVRKQQKKRDVTRWESNKARKIPIFFWLFYSYFRITKHLFSRGFSG